MLALHQSKQLTFLAKAITWYLFEVKFLSARILLPYAFQSSLFKRKYMLIFWKAKLHRLAYQYFTIFILYWVRMPEGVCKRVILFMWNWWVEKSQKISIKIENVQENLLLLKYKSYLHSHYVLICKCQIDVLCFMSIIQCRRLSWEFSHLLWKFMQKWELV